MIKYFRHIVQRTYDVMLDLSAKPNAMLFLFIVAFAESSFFPIPPDVMLIPMVWPHLIKHGVLPDWLLLPAY